MVYLIACDDGHGMETAGKRTPPIKSDLILRGVKYKKDDSIRENAFNEGIMEYFIKGCKRCGINTIQVAQGDKDIPLSTRVFKANSNNADLYISFHSNALGEEWQEKAYGLVVITHYNCKAKTKILADNVYNFLKDEKLVDWYSDGENKYGVRNDKDISGFSLYVLKNTKMPAILVEYGFMDSWEDVKRMVTPQFQKSCAEATLRGVCKTLGTKYIEEKNIEVSIPEFIKIIRNVNCRNKADFSKDEYIVSELKVGEVFTVVDRVKSNCNTDMYKLKSGLYVTTSSKYVEEYKK